MSAQCSANFDGSSSYLYRSNFTGNPSAFTVSQWVYLAAAQSARTFFSNSASPTGTGWAMGISDATSNKIKFYLGSNTLYQSGTLTPGTWAFVVCTYDGTTAKIYLNGATTPDASLASAINYGTVPGGNYVGQASDSTQFLNGSLAALGYWNRALTAAETASLYNGRNGMAYADLSGTLLTSLVDYYDFAVASNLGLDSGPAGNTLTNVGASISVAIGKARVTQAVAEVVRDATAPHARVTQAVAEVVRDATAPHARATQAVAEVVRDGPSKIRVTHLVVEVVRSTSTWGPWPWFFDPEMGGHFSHMGMH